MAMERIEHDLAVVRTELARAESKATGLLGVAGAALTVILAGTTVHRLPLPAVLIGGAAAVTTAIAIGLLAWVIRPNLAGGSGGWLGYADLTPDQVCDRIAAGGDDADQLVVLARLARRKYGHVRTAVSLLIAVLVQVIAAAALAVVLT